MSEQRGSNPLFSRRQHRELPAAISRGLLDTWKAQPENALEYRKYLNSLRRKRHSAWAQYKAMGDRLGMR